MAIVIETRSIHGTVTRTRLRSGATRLQVKSGDVFRLIDEETGKAPTRVIIKQLDNDLLIENLETPAGQDESPSVELTDFYSACSISDPCHLQLPEGANASLADITPSTAAIGALPDGSFVLYESNAAGQTPKAVPADAGADSPGLLGEATRPVLYGLGAAAVIGLAASGGGGGGGGGDSAPQPGNSGNATPAPTSMPDGAFSVTQSTMGKSGRPVLAGTGTAGGVVTLDIDTNGDQVSDVVYRTTVGADGKWSADLATAQPVSGALPAAGLTGNAIIKASQAVGDQVSTLPDIRPTVNDTAPTTPTLDAVATDNIINAAEQRAPITLSGTADAGTGIQVSWGTTNHTTTAGADGKWTLNIPTTATAASAASVPITVTSTDALGNASQPLTRTVSVDARPPASPVIQAVGGTDNYVNAAEKPNGTTVNGTAEANSKVAVTLGTTVHTATADASGAWSVAFTGAELPGTDGRHQVSASATDAAGNTSATPTTATLIIDTTAPTIDNLRVGANNFVRSGQQFRVTGDTEGGATVVIDYYAGPNATTYTTQRVQVGGTENENDVSWTSPTFTAPRTAQTEPHRLVISSTDKAGNMTVTSQTFAVFGTGLPIGDASDTTTPALKEIGVPLSNHELFSEDHSLELVAAGPDTQATAGSQADGLADSQADMGGTGMFLADTTLAATEAVADTAASTPTPAGAMATVQAGTTDAATAISTATRTEDAGTGVKADSTTPDDAATRATAADGTAPPNDAVMAMTSSAQAMNRLLPQEDPATQLSPG